MNVEIGIEAVQFPEKECINEIFVAVYNRQKYIASVVDSSYQRCQQYKTVTP